MYSIIIADLGDLSKLKGFLDNSDIEFLNGTFYAICSTLDKEQQEEAKGLVEMGVLSSVELPENEETTTWLYEHYTPEIGYNELCVIRYAILNDFTILTDDAVLTKNANSLGAKVLSTSSLMAQADDYIVLDEDKELLFILDLLEEQPKYGKLDNTDITVCEENTNHDYERDFANTIKNNCVTSKK